MNRRTTLVVAMRAASAAVVGPGSAASAADATPVSVRTLATAEHITNATPVPVSRAFDQLRARTGRTPTRGTAVARSGPVTAESVICASNVFLRSAANGLVVSAELGFPGGDNGMLRARAAAIGPWELFTLCQDDVSGAVFLVSQGNGLAVSAELGNAEPRYAMLRARATAVGPWEVYFLFAVGDGTIAIQSAGNGLLVSAELGFAEPNYAMLRARSGAIGPWERFF